MMEMGISPDALNVLLLMGRKLLEGEVKVRRKTREEKQTGGRGTESNLPLPLPSCPWRWKQVTQVTFPLFVTYSSNGTHH